MSSMTRQMAISDPHDGAPVVLGAFEIRVRPDRETIHVQPVGELDLATCVRLGEQLRQLLASGFARIVIDLRELTFMDSAGLQLLLALDDQARCDGWQLSLVQGPPAVRRIFELTATLGRLPFTAAGTPVESR